MAAYDRGLIPYWQIAAVSVAEFVFWACALDERLKKVDSKYAARRDADEHGQVLPGLRFARDRHLHQVAVTTSLMFVFERSDPNGPADGFIVSNVWRPLDAIPGPTGSHKRNRDLPAQRATYEKHLEGRWPALAIGDALDFLNREVAAQGIEVLDPPRET
jgi:hypothetical protein